MTWTTLSLSSPSLAARTLTTATAARLSCTVVQYYELWIYQLCSFSSIHQHEDKDFFYYYYSINTKILRWFPSSIGPVKYYYISGRVDRKSTDLTNYRLRWRCRPWRIFPKYHRNIIGIVRLIVSGKFLTKKNKTKKTYLCIFVVILFVYKWSEKNNEKRREKKKKKYERKW